jgi:N-acetylneuraminic acid mutarotase
MYKYLLIILFINTLFLGCFGSKNESRIISEYINENNTDTEEISETIIQDSKNNEMKLMNYNNYSVSSKIYFIHRKEHIKLLDEFSQDELSEYIEILFIIYYV